MPETIIKVKIWGVILVLCGLIGYLFICSTALESRITKIETAFTYIVTSLNKVEKVVTEVRDDQLRRERKGQ
jgi:hypothetical protein